MVGPHQFTEDLPNFTRDEIDRYIEGMADRCSNLASLAARYKDEIHKISEDQSLPHEETLKQITHYRDQMQHIVAMTQELSDACQRGLIELDLRGELS